MREAIFKALEGIGLFLPDDEKNSDDDIDLTEYIMDSLQFISFVTGLEELLGIEIPDEYLNPNSIQSSKAFIEILKDEIITQKG